MPDSITIPSQFNGPLTSGNGGYAAGAVAAFVEGPAEVTLRRPVPLDQPMQIVRGEDGTVRALEGEELVAEGRPVPDFELEVPAPVTPEQARDAERRYRGLAEGPFSRCFVCGRAREDSLGVFAGAVEGRQLVASTWTPPSSLADSEGRVPAEIVWAVLDCPTMFGSCIDEEELPPMVMLGRLSARIESPVLAGEEHVVIGWPIEVDGRKRHAGSAVLSASGEVLASARALMIEPRAA